MTASTGVKRACPSCTQARRGYAGSMRSCAVRESWIYPGFEASNYNLAVPGLVYMDTRTPTTSISAEVRYTLDD